MKKVLIVTALIVIIAAGAAGLFIATFDINTFKPAIVGRLEVLTGNQVDIGRLSLTWKGKLLLGIKDFKILVDEYGEPRTVLSFDSASAAVDLMPLFARQLHVSSVSIERPVMAVIRDKEGRCNLAGYNPPRPSVFPADIATTPAPAHTPKVSLIPAGTVPGFDIKTMTITDGTVRFINRSGEPAEITMRKFNASVRDVSSAGPVKFNVTMAVASDERNLSVSGSVEGSNAAGISVKDLVLEADLAAFSHAEVLKALPALGRMGLREGMAGVLKTNFSSLKIDGGKVSEISGDVTFTGGRLVFAQVKVPLEDLGFYATASGAEVEFKSFSARLSTGVVKGSADIKDIFTNPRTNIKVTAEVRGLEQFLSRVMSLSQNLDGNARISFDGSMSGKTWTEISRTLTGKGALVLENGMLSNANAITDTLGSLALFPGLISGIQGYAPAPMKQAMGERYTALKPFKQAYQIEGGYIILPDLILQSDYMDMRGAAKMSLTGDLSGNGMIRFSPTVSNAIISTVPQMRAIADPQGLITFPLAFKGGGGTFKIIPDMKYIGQRVAVQAAGDALSGYLQKAAAPDQAAAAQQPAAPAKAPKVKDLLKAFAEEAARAQ